MKTKYNFNFVLVVDLVLFCALPIFKTIIAQDYLNINATGGNYTSLLSEMKEITFDGSGNATFIKTDDSFVTIALNTITDLTVSPTSNGGSPLPVELVSFVAALSDLTVLLNWETATETNNYGFEVQKSEARSQNSEESWESIGFIQGHGTTNSPKSYSFTDPLNLDLNPNLNRIDYRLKQIDNDGTFNYSKTITVDLATIIGIEDDEIPIVYSLSQNYPNPFNPTTTIKFGLPESGFVNLNVYNILGQEVASLVNKEMTAGYHEVSFGTNNLASGMYIYRISVGNKFTAIKKMLLLR